ALFYFDLVRGFGGVPKITQHVNIDEARNTPRTSADSIYTLILDDLEIAHSNLPAKGAIETGRATSEAAAALLGQVNVHRENYETALTYLDQVESINYNLLDNFDDIYSLEKENHEECNFTLTHIQY